MSDTENIIGSLSSLLCILSVWKSLNACGLWAPNRGQARRCTRAMELCIRTSAHINPCDANQFCCADAPEIEVERGWVHSGEGNEAQLACIVHAEPSAEVSTPPI
jgi:hypothetical protein